MADWLPTDSTETLVAWYDASDTGSITESGGVVSAWADQTANGYDLAATGNPITGSTTLDGKNVIDMTSDYFMDTNVSLPSNLLVIAVIKINSVDDAFDSAFAADGGTDWQFEANTASSFEGQINNTSGGGSATNTSSIEDTWQVLSLEFDYSNTTNRIKLYGAEIASAGSAGDLSGSKTWTIGTNRNRNAHVNNMNVAEVILVDTNDQDEIAKFEGYLAWKWGLEASLDAGHEYYSAAPSVGGGTNITTTVGSVEVTAVNAVIAKHKAIASTVGSVDVTGVNAVISTSSNVEIATTVGNVQIAGVNASLNKGVAVSTSVGSVTVTGVNATIDTSTNVEVSVSVGSVQVSGVNAVIEISGLTQIITTVGSVTVTGTDAVINKILPISVSVGSIDVTGINAAISKQKAVSAAVGSVEVSGVSATIVTPTVIVTGAGTVVVTGYDAVISGLLWTEVSAASTTWTPISDASTTWTEI